MTSTYYFYFSYFIFYLEKNIYLIHTKNCKLKVSQYQQKRQFGLWNLVYTNLITISLHKKTYFEFHFWSGLKLQHITLPPSKIFMTKNINSLDPVPTTIWSELIYNPSCRCHWEIAWRNSNVPERNHGQGHSIFYR